MMLRRVSVSCFAVLVLFCSALRGSEMPALPDVDFSQHEALSVVRVIDGDTIVLNLDEQATTVRLIGVDTPETVHPSKPVEAYGKEASQFSRNLLRGESVYLVGENEVLEKDKYGRTLGYVFRVPDGLFVNLEIIRQGYGHAYTRFPFQHMELFRFFEQRARDAEKGLWANAATDPAEGKPVAGKYSWFQDGRVKREVTLHADRSVEIGGTKTEEHAWELTDAGLVLHVYGARWVFQRNPKGSFRGRYEGPASPRVGEQAWLLQGFKTASVRPKTQRGNTGRQATGLGSPTVYVTRTGTKYHRSGCRYLRQSSIAVSGQDALARGYSRCSVCAVSRGSGLRTTTPRIRVPGSAFGRPITGRPISGTPLSRRKITGSTLGTRNRAENGSYFGEISSTTGRPKTVRVRGYYRKDGTYVRGHYRSRPRR